MSASALKLAARRLGFHTGFYRLAQLARRGRGLILVFHRFSEDDRREVGQLPITRFAEYMEYLTRHYRVVSLRDMLEEFQRGVVRPYTTAVTVDDGYQDAFSLAAPVLRRYGVPATFFVVSDFVEGRLWIWTERLRFVIQRAPPEPVAFRHGRSSHLLEIRDEGKRVRTREQWVQYAKRLPIAEREELIGALADACKVEIPIVPPSELRAMTWAELRALAAEGFDIGAHTRTHPILAQVGAKLLREEIRGCKEQLEQRLGLPVRHFAYPNGKSEDYTPQVVEEVSRAGYRAAVTTVPGWSTASTSRFELPRVDGAGADPAQFAYSVAGVEVVKYRATQAASKWFARAKASAVGIPQ